MKKKKLLYIGNKLGHKGYTATAIDVLAPQLRSEGYELVAVSDKKIKAQRMLHMVQTVWKHRKDTAFVLIDTYSTLNFYYAHIVAKLCRRLSLAYIPILHGGNLPQRLKRSPQKSKKLFGMAYRNVAPSKYLYNAFAAQGFEYLTHIPNTLAIERYPFLPRNEIRPSLLWVRSFAKLYNPMLAIDVLVTLRNKGYNATLTMVGPAKDESFAQCQAKAKTSNLPVTFTGILPKEEWIALAAKHDIFINTTNVDNTPVSVMEGMALGLPVVSTNVGGLPFLIENEISGVLVDPNDPDAFVAAIEWLITHPDRAHNLALAARKKVERFDWEEVKELWNSLLRQ